MHQSHYQPLPEIILLDMDGTLLDLRYDDQFWEQFLPRAYAGHHGIDIETARADLAASLKAARGTLAWYNIDHWSVELGVNILQLKREYNGLIRYRPGTLDFLQRTKSLAIPTVLATNAHPDLVEFKITALREQGLPFTSFFDAIVTSHQYQAAKESIDFWAALENDQCFDPKAALFVDDNLAVLKAAATFGIGRCVAVDQPDLSKPPKAVTDYESVTSLDEIQFAS